MQELVRVAFLAHEVNSILSRNEPPSESDKELLKEATTFLQGALAAGRALVSQDFNAAKTRQIEAFGWMADVLVITSGRENANSSAEVSNLTESLIKTLQGFSKGSEVPESKLMQARVFFKTLRNVILNSQRQAPRPPELQGVA
jgi:hypothetical protein